MRKVELGLLSDETKIIVLQEEASKLLESPVGQKILRELNAFDALAHLDKARVRPPEGREYSTDDYQKHPAKFSITEFYPAVYFVQDDLILTSDNAFSHRERLAGQIAEKMPDLFDRLQQPETRFVLGDTFKVKGTDIQFLAIRGEPNVHLNEIRAAYARQLAKHGMLLLLWNNDEEWEEEQLKKPKFTRYADFKKRFDEAKGLGGDVLAAFGGHVPNYPERYKWTIISPS